MDTPREAPRLEADKIAEACTVLAAIDDLEGLCASLENKTTQKILLLEQLNQRVTPG